MQLKEPQEIHGHSFDELTGKYLLPVRIYREADGSCPLPHNTVDFPPHGKIEQHETWRINAERTAWDIVPDYRGVMLWDKATAAPVLNELSLAEIPPDTCTLLSPIPISPADPAMNVWCVEEDTWTLGPDFSRTPVWEKSNGAILPMMQPGEPLPASATVKAPPRDINGPVYFDDSLDRWVVVPPAEIPEFPSPRPEPTDE